MMQVGIFTGYFPYGLEETAARIRRLGFNAVQLDLDFRDLDTATEAIGPALGRRIRESLRAHDLPVAAISGYTNIVHPDGETRRRLLDRLKAIIRHAREFGSPYVISETGTFHPESDWVDHPRNHSAAGYEEARDTIGALVETARQADGVFLVETYVNNVIGSVEETLRLFAEIASPHLGLLMDPTNYFDGENIGDMAGTLNRIFDALDGKVLVAHAKDVKRATDRAEKHAAIDASPAHSFRGAGAIELPAPGLGVLDYELYLRRLGRHHPNIPIIIEHLEEADIPRAKAFLDGALARAGA